MNVNKKFASHAVDKNKPGPGPAIIRTFVIQVVCLTLSNLPKIHPRHLPAETAISLAPVSK
jgi:hypothetical protein